MAANQSGSAVFDLQRRFLVHRMKSQGFTSEQIGLHVGLSGRQIERLLRGGLPPEHPDTAWRADAACQYIGDPEIFFPEKGATGVQAKQVCRHCPVQAECLQEALWHDTHERAVYGVWGGTTASERLRLRLRKAAR